MTRTSFKPRPGFVTEGLFIAFPLSMPEDGLPIPPDEAYISTLCLSADGQRIYGATRGDRCHCFVSMHKGAVGGILDVGTIAEATHVIVLVEGDTRKQNKHSFTQLFAVGETPDGTGCWEMSCPRFVNTIQEPSYPRPRVDKKSFVSGWRGIAGGVVLGRDSILCVCRNGMLVFNLSDGSCSSQIAVDDAPPISRPYKVGENTIVWIDADGRLCRYTLGSVIERRGPKLQIPGPLSCSCCRGDDLLGALPDGGLRSWDVQTGESRECVRLSLAPVTCMTALPDGRVYGTCGDGISQFFRIDPDNSPQALGSIASVIHSIRHGFEFADALTTSEGVIYLAEYDRGSHLWAFVPPHAISNSSNLSVS